LIQHRSIHVRLRERHPTPDATGLIDADQIRARMAGAVDGRVRDAKAR
jgi:hypothetical protein